MIRFQSVSKVFKRNRVLDTVNLEIGIGERIALIGSNGAGKTTLIRCLLGEYVCKGRVTIDGMNPRSQRTQVLGRIGFVPQLPPALKMPVKQLVGFAAGACGSDPKAILAIAEKLGLDIKPIASRPFNRLSGGMKQKLLIAIALGRNCSILVLDEPAANLDPRARHIFFDLLAERLERTTMIISSHRLDEVAQLVNRVVEMDVGRIVLDDRVAKASGISTVFDVKIALLHSDEAIAKTMRNWNFTGSANGYEWTGEVAGPDRLRFLGILARYSGLLTRLELREKEH